MCTEFWLISAPGEETRQQTWELLMATTNKYPGLCKNYKINMPDFKVGTLDTLVGLCDDLSKLDAYVESVCRKLTACMIDALEDRGASINEHLKANNTDLSTYLTRFQWEASRYPIKHSLKAIHDSINSSVGQIDADLKSKSSAYNSVKSNLKNLERKQTGSLLVRNLADLVNSRHFVTGSEYLTTLLVVVPKPLFKDWQQKYQHLATYVVPQSSELIYEDNEHGLFNVTLFSRSIDEFKGRCKENRFVVRDFHYDEKKINEGKNLLNQLEAEKQSKFQQLFFWLKVSFSESFVAWIHVKLLRLFVESVLRYGLPVNFLSVIIAPNKRQQRKLREVLNGLYSHLDTSVGSNAPMEDIPGLNMGQQEYYPYVYFKINIDMVTQI